MGHPWKDLIVWQRSHEFVLRVYKLTSTYPKNEQFGLCQQLRRSACSVPANIVEGKSRRTDKEFLAYLHNSRGSLEESRYHLLLSKDLGYIEPEQYNELEKLATEVSFLLNKLINSISK